MATKSATKPVTLSEDSRKTVQEIEEKAALLMLAVAGIGAEDYDLEVAVEPAARLAQRLHTDILTLVEVLGVEV